MLSFSMIPAVLSTLFLLFIIAALIRHGVRILQHYKKLKQERIAVPGTIVGQPVEGKGEKDYYQIVRFITRDNKEIIATHKFEGSMAEKGQRVMVYYSPDCPNDFVIKSRGVRCNAFVTILIAVGFLVYTIAYRVHHQKLISFFS